MDISITVPRGKQVFANGDRVSISGRAGSRPTAGVADEPMSTYLAVFAAGDFQVDSGVRNGLPWRAIVSKQMSRDARQDNMALMRQTPAVVDGPRGGPRRLPVQQVGGLVTGLDVYFALENQTLPTYPVTGRRLHLAGRARAGAPVVRRLGGAAPVEGHLAQRGRRHVHGGPLGRDPRRAVGRRVAPLRLRRAGSAESAFWDLEIGDPGADHIFAGPVYTRGRDDVPGAAQPDRRARTSGRCCRPGSARTATASAPAGRSRSWPRRSAARTCDEFFRAWLDVGRKPADVAANGLG